MATLIKIDKNGSKHFEGYVECDRCQGRGQYWWGAMINGSPQYSGTCFKCDGAGKVLSKWIERTPEYQAKLDAKREAKHAQDRAKRESEQAAIMAQRLKEKAEREAAEAARRAISQYVGNVGDKLTIKVKLEKKVNYTAPKYGGYGTDVRTIYTFADENGNKLIWNTSATLGRDIEDENGGWDFIPVLEGDEVTIKATVKGFGAYMGERQTELQRVKLI